MKKTLAIIAALAFISSPAFASEGIDGAKLFNKKCKMCHKMEKSRIAPAVRAMNTDAETLYSTITEGKKRMPKFGKRLSEDEINALVSYIQSNIQHQ